METATMVYQSINNEAPDYRSTLFERYSQLEDYMKRKREQYAEHLVKRKTEAILSLKGSQERTRQQ